MKNFRKDLYRVRQKGLTLVEILVVVTVIVAITGLAAFAATSYAKTSRDSARESKAAIISNALEKYYTENGEYASVELMTSPNTDLVKQKLGIADKDVFKFPLAEDSTTNSVTDESPSTTKITYIADTVDPAQDSQCQGNVNGYCDAFELRYIKESDGSLVVIKSKNNDFVAPDTLSAPPKPSVSVSYINSSTLRFTAGGANCGANSTEYKIRYNTTSVAASSMPDWSTVNWTASTTRNINPSSFINFYVQSIARCVNGFSEKSPDSPASDIVTYVKPTPPATPTVTATAIATSSKSIRLTYSSPTATSYSVSGPGSAASCTSSPCTVTGLSGSTQYTFNVVASNIAGSSPAKSATVTTTPAPAIPAAPSIWNAESGAGTNYAWSTVTCNVGSPKYAYQFHLPYYNGWSGEGVTDGTNVSWSDTSTQGATYRVYLAAYCQNGSETSGRSAGNYAANGSYYSTYSDYTRFISSEIYAYGGFTQIVRQASSPNSRWGESYVSSLYGACPSGTIPSYSYNITINGATDPGYAYGTWISYPYIIRPTHLPASVPIPGGTYDTVLEVMWRARCTNPTTWAVGNYNTSDLYGNVQNRNGSTWRRNCLGNSHTPIGGNSNLLNHVCTPADGYWDFNINSL